MAWMSVHAAAQTKLDGLVNVRGDSMEPLLEHGDVVGLRKVESIREGDVIIAQHLGDDTIYIKVYGGHNEESGTVYLLSINPSYGIIRARTAEVGILGQAHSLFRLRPLRIDWKGTDV